jgi:uncharacterized protein YcnI
MRTRLVSAVLAVLAAAVAGAGAGAFAGVGAASAHVTVNPREAVQGGYGKFSFRVPNERDGASTVKLEVVIPTETAIASVSTRPVPGWTVTVERSTLPTPLTVHDSEVTEAVSKLTWTASEGSAVAPGQFQEFDVSAGPLPAVDRIVFKAVQTYSDGEVVRWIEEPVAGQPEPERPAPVLKLTTAIAAPATVVNAAPAGASVATARSGDMPAWVLPLVLASLAIAVGALVLAFVAWRRRPAAA